VSKPWKPGKETVALPAEPRPSRIRRQPPPVHARVVRAPPSREREMWMGIAGVLLITACTAALIVGFSEVTSYRASVAAERAAGESFGYCHNGGDRDCVFDGDTIIMAGERVGVAGIDAPELHPARCADEARRGAQAAVRLHDLINRGPLTLTADGPDRDADGRLMRKMSVGGVDVGGALIASGVARELGEGRRSWC
jgi:endonuclease YncB( thermonuclease family)